MKVLLLGGPQSTQTVALTITGGKPSFLVEIWAKVRPLRDKHAKICMAPITQFRGKGFRITITDGKPSFLVEIWVDVRLLRDKHRQYLQEIAADCFSAHPLRYFQAPHSPVSSALDLVRCAQQDPAYSLSQS